MRKCKICGGKDFSGMNSRSKICAKKHYYKCPNCGKLILIKTKKELAHYSEKNCEFDNLVIISNTEDECIFMHSEPICKCICNDCYTLDEFVSARNNIRRERMRITTKNKYGVDFASQLPEFQEQVRITSLRKYGEESYARTDECKEKTKKTILKRYGKEYYFQTDDYKEKRKKNSLDKYGVEYPTQSDIVKNKIKASMLERYGKEYYSQTDECKAKVKKTCQDRYDVDNPAQAKHVKEKTKKYFQDTFGVDNPFQSTEIKEKIRQFYIDNYGVEHVSQVQAVKDKKEQTMLSRYGCKAPLQVPEFLIKFFITNFDKYGVPTPCMLNYDNHNWIRTRLNLNGYVFTTRSFWETVFSLYLFKNDVSFQYETLNFAYEYNGEPHVYVPDFYLPEFDYVVEIKGYEADSAVTDLKGAAVMGAGYGFEVIRDVSFFVDWLVENTSIDLVALKENSRECDGVYDFKVEK